MAGKKPPARADRDEATRIALSGIANGVDLGDIAYRLGPLHPRHDTFPGDVLVELAADAIEESEATRDRPIEFENIRERYLPELQARTKAEHHKSKYAIRAAAMLRGGVDPGLLDEVVWWRTDDLWWWSLQALVIYIRAAAERTGEPVAAVCERIAARHGVSVTSPTR